MMNDITELVKSAANGDKTAFDSLYRLTRNGVWYTCISLLKNKENAMDVMQDTYLTALEKLNTLENPASVQSWLNKIAANKCRNSLNSASNKTAAENGGEILENIPDESLLPEEYVDDEAKRRIIMDIIERALSDEQYKTVILYYFDEMTAAEIAALMGCHEKTVLYRLKTARLKIKEELLRYEKENRDKLHSVVPIAFLTRLLRAEAENTVVPQMSVIFRTSSDSLKIPSESAAEAAKTGGKIMFKSLKSKIIAGVCAVAVAGGGVAAGIAAARSSDKEHSNGTVSPDFTLPEQTNEDNPTSAGSPSVSDKPTNAGGQTVADDSTRETFSDNRPLPVPEDYEYVEIEGGIRIILYTGSDECLTVPSEIDGKKVLEIEDGEDGYFVFYRFDEPNNIREITLSDGITKLGYNLFAHLPNLKTVTLPDSVVSIENGTFTDCASLESVNLPEGEDSFNYTFDECVSLTDVTLPDSAETLYNTFSGCTSLETVIIPKNVIILESTFENCTSLKNVTFECIDLTEIGMDTFKNCTSLETIVIPDGVDRIFDSVFSGCTNLKNVTLPDTLEKIDDEAFMDCKKLSEIILPDGISEISETAFEGCKDIKIIYKNKTYDYGQIDALLSDISQ